jgi:hypothetical protein
MCAPVPTKRLTAMSYNLPHKPHSRLTPKLNRQQAAFNIQRAGDLMKEIITRGFDTTGETE